MADKKGQTIIIKKIKKGGHGHHGGAWKVAFADFMTAMMAFFLVMWLMGADEETKAAISGYFNNPSSDAYVGASPNTPKGGDELKEFSDSRPPGGRPLDMPAGKTNTETSPDSSLQEIKELLEETISLELGMTSLSDQVTMVYDSNGLVLRIAVKDFFAENSVEIKQDLLPVIHRVGKVLGMTQKLIRIEGHTDKRESRAEGYASSWELSSARAAWVAQYWLKSFNTLSPDRLQVAGNSHFRPVDKSDTERGRAANRRVEIIILNNQYQ